MIEVRYMHRLGNNMFQYCLGRILAEELGLALNCRPIGAFPNTASLVGGRECHRPVESYSGQQLPLAEILSNKAPRRIVLEGHFQRAEYYRGYEDRIRTWLLPRDVYRGPLPDLFMHIRRTDYVQHGWALPFSYYAAALEHLLPEGGSIWIGTDDPADPFFRHFQKWKPFFYNGDALTQMSLMSQVPRLVMSQSTYSWWPAFLAQNSQAVACPVPAHGCWAGDEAYTRGIDLIEKDRFICIDVPERYEPDQLESVYQKWRLLKGKVARRINRYTVSALPMTP